MAELCNTKYGMSSPKCKKPRRGYRPQRPGVRLRCRCLRLARFMGGASKGFGGNRAASIAASHARIMIVGTSSKPPSWRYRRRLARGERGFRGSLAHLSFARFLDLGFRCGLVEARGRVGVVGIPNERATRAPHLPVGAEAGLAGSRAAVAHGVVFSGPLSKGARLRNAC